MKKFILNTFVFVVPFILLYSINLICFDQRAGEGDLARMAYIYANPSPRSWIDGKYELTKKYKLLSEVNLTSKEKFDVVTIGDSFSEQENLGYKNFLAYEGASVLHVDRYISGSNPIQTLVSMVNSGLFEYIQTDFIVVQSIERDFNTRTANIDFNGRLDLEILSRKLKNHDSEAPNYNYQFFSDATLKMPLNNFQFLFTDKPLFSNTYKVEAIQDNLFTNSPDNLLFYKHDLRSLGLKNDSLKTLESIQAINKVNELLLKHDISLIMLVSPDKYDLYYPYIKDATKYKKPTFFSKYEGEAKDYINIDTYRIFSNSMSTETDIYYYDDTHWSPKAANIVAEEIWEIMND